MLSDFGLRSDGEGLTFESLVWECKVSAGRNVIKGDGDRAMNGVFLFVPVENWHNISPAAQ